MLIFLNIKQDYVCCQCFRERTIPNQVMLPVIQKHLANWQTKLAIRSVEG